MEENIIGFTQEYRNYDNYRNRFEILLNLNHHGYTITEREKINGEFDNLDVKMRLAFGIEEIALNSLFVDEKQGALKECHLLYYKLADLWFAYETFIKFIAAIKTIQPKNINKIKWLDTPGYADYRALPNLIQNVGIVNRKLHGEFGSGQGYTDLIKYLDYCEQEASNNQITRLASIRTQIFSRGYTLDHPEILTLIYSIRNNFVHNGETTVVPNNFSFENKGRLLKILYPYLTMVVISVTNKAISEI
jgi:hypothetical protein